jgi:hypothetical protein
MSKKAKRLIAAALAAVLMAAVAALVVLYPIAVAATCPGCYGLRQAAPDVYVDDGATPEQRRQVVDMIAAARQRVSDYLGAMRSSPRVLVCLSAECYEHIGGGGEKGQALRDRALALSPGGADVVIAGHELTHAELYRRHDSRYLTTKPPGERCPIDYAQALAAVRAGAAPSTDFYRDSACVVDRWVAAHGGADAVLDLVRRLRAGESFAAVVVT